MRLAAGSVGALLLAVWMIGTEAEAAPGVDSLRVHVLDCGRLRGIETSQLLAEVPERPARIDMVNRCFLIEHPKGRLIWDTGFEHSFKVGVMKAAFALSTLWRSAIIRGPRLAKQLDALGLEVSDIDFVALSHLHWDHAGDGNAFSTAVWIVQRSELEWGLADSDDVNRPHVDPGTYSALRDSEKIVLDGDYDVFGDGSVVVLSAPGHTPGHQCLFLDLPQRGPVVLSGDLYHNVLNLEYHAPPSFNTDIEQTRRSMQRIDAFVAEQHAELWIQHDPTSGPQAPALIE